MARRAFLAAVGLLLLLAFACGRGNDRKELTLEGLLAATLSPNDIRELRPQPEAWWPSFPEFNVGFDPAPSPIDGDRFWVAQNYQRIGDSANQHVQTTLALFEDEQAAEAGLAAIAEANDQGGTTVEGPAVGDEFRYFTRKGAAADADPLAPPSFETTLRFRVGLVVGRISMFSDPGYEGADSLARLFAPVEERIHAFLAGELEGEPLPEWMSELMPSSAAAAAATVGPVFGSAVRPPQSWALIDSTGDPLAVRDNLKELGTTELGLRRYGLEADPDLVVEVVLFQMANEDAAGSWVQDFLDSVTPELALSAGQTGTLSGFSAYDGSIYELQFAKGRFAGDVACFAPFGETSQACEEPVRMLAEQWYAELPE